MRADVEGNLTGFDGMMSQALTKALMDDDELNIDPTELLWGGVGQQSGTEVEASALCEVTDWLKRNDSASTDGKYVSVVPGHAQFLGLMIDQISFCFYFFVSLKTRVYAGDVE